MSTPTPAQHDDCNLLSISTHISVSKIRRDDEDRDFDLSVDSDEALARTRQDLPELLAEHIAEMPFATQLPATEWVKFNAMLHALKSELFEVIDAEYENEYIGPDERGPEERNLHLHFTIKCDPSIPLTKEMTTQFTEIIQSYTEGYQAEISITPGAKQQALLQKVEANVQQFLQGTAGRDGIVDLVNGGNVEIDQILLLTKALHKDITPPFTFDSMSESLTESALRSSPEDTVRQACQDAALENAFIQKLPELYVRANIVTPALQVQTSPDTQPTNTGQGRYKP